VSSFVSSFVDAVFATEEFVFTFGGLFVFSCAACAWFVAEFCPELRSPSARGTSELFRLHPSKSKQISNTILRGMKSKPKRTRPIHNTQIDHALV
jgi:hypothetical protein